MQPGAAALDGVRNLLERVEGAGVDVPGLGADDRGARSRFQSRLQCLWTHPALVIHGQRLDLRSADAK
jgi:hypothetical protein